MEMYQRFFGNVKVFSSGNIVSAYPEVNDQTAFPIAKLFAGSVACNFFGVIKVPAVNRSFF